jgi:hypothetical protein
VCVCVCVCVCVFQCSQSITRAHTQTAADVMASVHRLAAISGPWRNALLQLLRRRVIECVVVSVV